MSIASAQLKKLRLHLRLTQDEFAEKINFKRNSVSMIESGRNNPTFEMIIAINKEFGVSADYFINDISPDENSNIVVNNVNNNDVVNSTSHDVVNRKVTLKSDNPDTSMQRLSEIDLLNKIQQNCRRINNLYQRLVDIRSLLFQELKLKLDHFGSEKDINLFWELSRPNTYNINGESFFGYYYEKLDFEARLQFFERQEAFIQLLTDTFFDDFKLLYNGIRIPASKELVTSFLNEREQQTGKWQYKHIL